MPLDIYRLDQVLHLHASFRQFLLVALSQLKQPRDHYIHAPEDSTRHAVNQRNDVFRRIRARRSLQNRSRFGLRKLRQKIMQGDP
jgi:hypothetical protein